MLWWTLRQLNSRDESNRITAIRDLCNSKDERVFQHLISALSNTSSEVRRRASDKLGDFKNKDATQPLLKLLNDESPTVRQTAIAALDRIGDEDARTFIMPLLKDKDIYVCQAAWSALRNVDSPEVKRALAEYWDSNAGRQVRDETKRNIARRDAQRAEREHHPSGAKPTAQAQALTLAEGLIFVERAVRNVGIGDPALPLIMMPVTSLLQKKGMGGKVKVPVGTETVVAVVSMLIMSLVFFKNYNGLILADSFELAKESFTKGLGGTRVAANELAAQCAKVLADGDALLESGALETPTHVTKALQQALDDHDSIVVLEYATFKDMRGLLYLRGDEAQLIAKTSNPKRGQHLIELRRAFRKVNTAIRVSSGVLELHDDLDVTGSL